MIRSEQFYNKFATWIIKRNNPKWLEVLEEQYKDRYYISFSEANIKYYNEDFINDLKYKDLNPIITIHFPEIKITNGILNHTIYDLYVHLKLYIGNNFKVTTHTGVNIIGSRTTFTLTELANSYAHSHLGRSAKYKNDPYKNFCLGEGPLRGAERNWHTKEKIEIEFFFSLLEDYLKWESIAGVPYVKIETLGSEVLDTININENSIVTILRNININPIIRITDRIEVLPTEEFEMAIANTNYLYNHMTCNKTSEGKYVNYSNNVENLDSDDNEILQYTLQQDLFYFKNQYLKTKLINSIENGNEQLQKYPHPSITKQICEYLSRKLTNYYYTKTINSRTQGENTVENSTECIKENTVSVS